jgi:AcrR family transcriptional regulator
MPVPRGRPAPATPARRPRRSSAEVRTLVLEAAVETFAREGYAGATTREIARSAGVLESTMFRIFPTKELLYEAAVVEPFEHFLNDFHDRWMSAPVPGGDPHEVLRQFVVGMHELVRRNRSIISALNSDVVSAATQRAFDGLEQVGDAIAQNYQLDFDVAVAVRIATVAVASVSLLEESLFPAEAGIGSDRVVDEMVRMLVGATLYQPDVSVPPPPAAARQAGRPPGHGEPGR